MAPPIETARFDKIRIQDVVKALAERERLGREKFNLDNGFRKATRYAFIDRAGVRHEDPKAIVGVAYGYRWPELGRLRGADFPSSDRLVRDTLRRLDFEIIDTIAPEFADDEEPISEDPYDRALRAIRIRRGQRKFRESLFKTYEGRCAISDCSIPDLLDAAHISPHAKGGTYEITNGLLLRTDLHTLHDCDLLAINPSTRLVCLAPELRKSEYQQFNGKPLRAPMSAHHSPNKDALAARFRRLRTE